MRAARELDNLQPYTQHEQHRMCTASTRQHKPPPSALHYSAARLGDDRSDQLTRQGNTFWNAFPLAASKNAVHSTAGPHVQQ
jgi:hypothetical protein